MGSASRICSKVDWSHGREIAMIGIMRVAPVKVGSLIILLLCREAALCVKGLSRKHRSFATRNYFPPSNVGLKHENYTGDELHKNRQNGAKPECGIETLTFYRMIVNFPSQNGAK